MTQSGMRMMTDICLICGTERQNHEGAKHGFSEDGQLVSAAKKEKQSSTEHSLPFEVITRLLVTLVDRKVLTPEDLLFIYGGPRGKDIK